MKLLINKIYIGIEHLKGQKNEIGFVSQSHFVTYSCFSSLGLNSFFGTRTNLQIVSDS